MSTFTTTDHALTSRQRQIFDLIYASARDRGYQPSVRELCDETSIASPNGLMCHLKALERRGYLRQTGHARALEILKQPNGEPFYGFTEWRSDDQ